MYTIGKTGQVDYYGVIEHSSKHVEINEEIVKSRRVAALMHEGLHAVERKHGIKVPHSTITAMATAMIGLLPIYPRLIGKTWQIDLNQFPIEIRKVENGLNSDQALVKLITIVGYFYKWPIEDSMYKIFAQMIKTFKLNAKTLNEEDGTWQ